MAASHEEEDGGKLRCRVTDVREHSVMLEPGSGRACFLVPLGLVPGEVEVGDRVEVSARHAPVDLDAGPAGRMGQIFDEALDALQDMESGWGRPGAPADSSAA